MIFTFSKILELLAHYKYFILFPISIIEGPIVSVLAGLLASLGKLNFYLAWAILVMGDMAGDLIYYAIGHWGRKSFFDRYGHYIGVTTDRLVWAEGFFGRHSKKTLLFGKWTQTFGMPILIAAGVVGQNIWEFIWVNFLATIPKSLLFLSIGFYFGSFYARVNNYYNDFIFISVILALLALMVYFVRKTVQKYFRQP
jgi:membrane protein DedA with SNARE-associated domain